MSHYTKQDIMNIVEEEDVQFIRLQFTDITGDLKNVAITTSQLEKALNNKCMIDGSSIVGYVSIEESDLFLYPDLDTFEIFPWRPQQGKVARLLCDVYRPDRTPFEGDPRYILKNVLREAEELGYTIDVGPECEFFLFDLDESGEPSLNTKERGTYFDIAPLDAGENVRREIVLTLEDMGFVVEASHHEVAPAQHEVTIGYEDALKTADNILTFRMVARTIAKRHGLHATFMPKPVAGVNGSGMHINLSIKKDGVNIFNNPNDKLGISEEAYYFIAGILKHISSMTAIMNPLVNSYKRLVPGYEAPVYIAWSTTNRSPLIRIPAEKGPNTRIELRSPDPSTNPYLTLAVCIAAGLDGIKNKLTPPKSINKNIFELTEEERVEEGIEKLPADLKEAIEELDKSDFIKGVLGNHTSEKFIQSKTEEWNQYIKQISQWEIDNYLHRI